MTHVPYELIAGRVEDAMQRDRELDDAEASADVTARPRAHIDEAGANFLREQRKLLATDAAQVRG
jgi:hypothetical protein